MLDDMAIDDRLDVCLVVQVIDKIDARLTCHLLRQLLISRVASIEILHINMMYPIIM